MASVSLLDDFGVCNSCTKNVGNNFLSCYVCLRKFHASACSGNKTNILQVHFYKHSPVFDKSGVNANRRGKFLFACDECTTLNEIKNSQTIGDYIMHFKNEIESLKFAVDEMRMIIKTNIDVKNSKEEFEDKLTLKSK